MLSHVRKHIFTYEMSHDVPKPCFHTLSHEVFQKHKSCHVIFMCCNCFVWGSLTYLGTCCKICCICANRQWKCCTSLSGLSFCETRLSTSLDNVCDASQLCQNLWQSRTVLFLGCCAYSSSLRAAGSQKCNVYFSITCCQQAASQQLYVLHEVTLVYLLLIDLMVWL